MAATLAACGLLPGGQGNPTEPVLVTGRVVDADGRPVGGARIELQVNDYGAAVNVGDTVPVVFHQSFSANADGTFELHLAPTPALLAFAAKEGGSLNFSLYAFVGNDVAPWGFTRPLAGQTWADAPEFFELRPLGAPGGQPGPGVPAPAPAAT